MTRRTAAVGQDPIFTRARSGIAGDAERGSALVELTLVLPLLLLVMAGGADFARMFYTAHVLTDAARAGAQFCAQSSSTAATCTSNKPVIIQDIGTANNLGTLTIPFPTRLCECVTDGGTASSNDCVTACGSGTHRVVHVTVTASKTQSMLIRGIPGLPSSLTVSRSATLRAE